MLHPFIYIFGYTRFRVRAEDAHLVVELCRGQKRLYRNFTFHGEGDMSATVDIPLFFASSFMRDCLAAGIGVEVEGRYGLPSALWRYRRRYGIILGAALFLFLTLFSGEVLWSVRVEGNSSLSDREVVAILEDCGLSVGMLTRGLDTPSIETRALIYSDRIAWISINILGSVAEVHIIEDDGLKHEDVLGSDIVAERGGVIQWLEDIRGYQAVEIGQTVEAGDLLIGGRYPAEEGESQRYTTPRGRVYALTERNFSVFVPLKYEKKSYTGREKQEKYFIFFKKEVKFFENCGNSYTKCDTIDTVEYFSLPGGIILPFGVRTVRQLEYEIAEAKRSEESAIELALYTLRCKMESEVGDGMITRKALEGRFTEEGYELYCKAEYIEDIARTVTGVEN